MADFVYDQLVTSQDLNNIAIDLGAGNFSVFTDSSPYAVDKLNEITSALVGSGISSALDKFKISINNDGIVVGAGMAIFKSGRKIKLTEPLTLPLQTGDVYFEENQSTGNVSLNIGELPVDNYIHLATINEDLTISDRRVYAKAKVLLPSEGNSYHTTRTAVMNANNVNAGLLDDGTSEITLPIEGISKIFFICDGHSRYEFDILTQTFSGCVKYDYDGDDRHYIVSGQNYAHIRIQHIGSLDKYFTLTLVSSDDSSITFSTSIGTHSYLDDKTVTVEIYAFGGI